MQLPILSGIYCDGTPELRAAYPRNMVPITLSNGISEGYLRPGDGITQVGTGPGIDRGAINWNGVCYRAMGVQLVSVGADGSVTQLGSIPGAEQVTMDYSFDRLAIAAGGNLYYWNGALQQVTDPNLGRVNSVLWIDGYFMTTDGNALVVTNLNDPTTVNPLRYGSSEADPDPIVQLLKLRGEALAVNRYTIEYFDNIGGIGFPFQRNPGALLMRGAMGAHCAAIYMEKVAFLGSGREESPAVWMGNNGATEHISTREIDTLLQQYTEQQLSQAVVETRVDRDQQLLMIHLPDRTLVYDDVASRVVQQRVWYQLDSGLVSPATYRARNLVWCYNKWLCGDPTSTALGILDPTISTHYGKVIGWDFNTIIVYNGGHGAIFHQLELTTLPGRVPFGDNPVIWTSFSLDGETWSQERSCPAGVQGDRTRRITWLRQGRMPNWRIQRFRGTSDAHIAVARLEVQLEPLNA